MSKLESMPTRAEREMANWFEGFELDYFSTLTFAPKDGRVVGSKGAMSAFKEYLGQFPVKIPHVVIAEPRPSDGELRVHSLSSVPGADMKQLEREWGYGIACVTPCTENRVLYVAKKVCRFPDYLSRINP